MKTLRLALIAVAVMAVTNEVHAQSGRTPDLSGTWEAESADGPVTIIVRPDSSASFGDEIVRWRIVADTVYLAIGGEWLGYNYALRGSVLTLSGGDLEEPIDLKKLGPPTPRPAGVPVPPVPGMPPAPGAL
ncbi:MAG: hypothetical protein IH616_09160 [Gemmatimonadales bacterium]|jgi:hypothetical protein|nr:hypothetical protein [Gemmatimonadales bacterium]